MNNTHWILTYSGHRVWPLEMRPEDIDFQDIAHALALQCRYTGHCLVHFSVAHHSLLVSRSCPKWPLHGLLHDAAEAYVTDLSRPVKQALRDAGQHLYDQAEHQIMRAVWKRFGLEEPDDANQIQREVDAADLLLLATEARDLMPQPLPDEWQHQEKHGWPVLTNRIIPWTPGQSRIEFLNRFHALTDRKYQ